MHGPINIRFIICHSALYSPSYYECRYKNHKLVKSIDEDINRLKLSAIRWNIKKLCVPT